jgi:hypothetical protein
VRPVKNKMFPMFLICFLMEIYINNSKVSVDTNTLHCLQKRENVEIYILIRKNITIKVITNSKQLSIKQPKYTHSKECCAKKAQHGAI